MPLRLTLVPIDRRGETRFPLGPLPEFFDAVIAATRAMYQDLGYSEPWIGYVALADDVAVGTCGFKGPPVEGRVELAYFTFPEHEGKGVATAMAECLLELSLAQSPRPRITAQTLPDNPPSQRILERLGFAHVDSFEHPEDGWVWEWEWKDSE